MRKGIHKILITGGAGFIGSAFVRKCAQADYKIAIVDKLTYAADLKRIAEVKGRFSFYKVDICDKVKIENIFKKEKPDAVINFAAETHVDRSIKNAADFVKAMVRLGARRFIYTDISRDGTLTEPNFTAISDLINLVRFPIIAAGGISSIGHLRVLKKLGVEGAIVGKALYTGDINLKQALQQVNSDD